MFIYLFTGISKLVQINTSIEERVQTMVFLPKQQQP